MDVLVLANTKGGVGKTTLALHLGVEAERAGRRVVWVDLDPQASLTEAWEARAALTPALAEIAAMAEPVQERRAPALRQELARKLAALAAEGYDLALIDTPPEHFQAIHLDAGLAAPGAAVLVPIQPTPLALRAVGPLLAKLGGGDPAAAGGRFVFVVNEASPHRLVQSTPQAIAELSAHGRVAPVILHRRELYATATADGRTAGEISPSHPAAGEIRALWSFVESWINGTVEKPKRGSTAGRRKARS